MFMQTQISLAQQVDAVCDEWQRHGWTEQVAATMVRLGLTHHMFTPLYAITHGLISKLHTVHTKNLLITFENKLLSDIATTTFELRATTFLLMCIIEHHLARYDHGDPEQAAQAEHRFILALIAFKHLRDDILYDVRATSAADAEKAFILAKLSTMIEKEFSLSLEVLRDNKTQHLDLDTELRYSSDAGKLSRDPASHLRTTTTPIANLTQAITSALSATTTNTPEQTRVPH